MTCTPGVKQYCLQKQGLNITTTIRTKSKPFSRDVKSRIDSMFAKYMVLQKELQLEAAIYTL